MPPSEVKPEALEDLRDLASWVRLSAKMEVEKGKKNLLVCVDNERGVKAGPLLEKLGYATQGHLASLKRVCGRTSIEIPDGHRSMLFFPLSITPEPESMAPGNLKIAGELLEPGTYIQLTGSLELDAQLDCLVIALR